MHNDISSNDILRAGCDPLDLSKQKKLLDLGYIYPRGVRGGAALFFGWKSVFTEHPTAQPLVHCTLLKHEDDDNI